MLPDGFKANDRSIDHCPDDLPSRVWSAIRSWSDVRGGEGRTLPQAGHPMDQPAWLFSAFQILDAEWQLITLAQREEARKRASEQKG
ncbi:MAG: hypothetical protein ACO3CU_03735 [Candidatus Nanopelagicales bacterium]